MKWLIAALSVSLIFVTACQRPQVSSTTTVSGTPPSTVVLASDDIVNTPAGPAYRANVNQQGVTNPFVPVQTTVVSLAGAEDLRLDYRNAIQTQAGQTRNDILWLYGTSISGLQGQTALTVVFTPENLPSGIEAQPARTAVSPMTKAVMEIHISSGVQAESYSFQIRTEIGGKGYGTVPCTVEVSAE